MNVIIIYSRNMATPALIYVLLPGILTGGGGRNGVAAGAAAKSYNAGAWNRYNAF